MCVYAAVIYAAVIYAAVTVVCVCKLQKMLDMYTYILIYTLVAGFSFSLYVLFSSYVHIRLCIVYVSLLRITVCNCRMRG